MPKAILTGITGQDGYYLAELLLGKGYEVHGIVRGADPARKSAVRDKVILDLSGRAILHEMELDKSDIKDSIEKLVAEIMPAEIYHLAGQKQSKDFIADFASINLNLNITHYFLSAIKKYAPAARFFLAGSSEMFGNTRNTPSNEETPFHPLSPYAVSKVAAQDLIRAWRERQGVFACTGIFFSHESPYRDPMYVTRKIAIAAAQIARGQAQELVLGGLEPRRDWGYAPEYMEAAWMMLQAKTPADYVIGTGANHTVQEFVDLAFQAVNLDWRKYTKIDTSIPASEIATTLSDPSKIKAALGWQARTKFPDLVALLVNAELKKP